MNRLKSPWIVAMLLLCLGGALHLHARSDSRVPLPEKETALSSPSPAPYLEVKGGGGGGDVLPLQSTEVEAKVAGVIADVRIRQVYANRGSTPLEAVYIFPGATGAAVYRMEMKVGERVITAKVSPREKARKDYEKAKADGKRASLLEQQRPNVFQMNVAQIMPGDVVTIDLSYTELASPEAGEYEFVFPTVVGPRYRHRSEKSERDQWVVNPYLKPSDSGAVPGSDEPDPAAPRFRLQISLDTGLPIQDLSSPSHAVDIRFTDADKATVELKQEEDRADNRDFVLRYRLADQTIASGLLLSEGGKEKFFTLLVEPPKRVTSAVIPPRDYVFVIDVSGSMHGFPLDTSKQMLSELLGSLRETDTFNIIHFSGSAGVFSKASLPATAQNIREGTRFVEQFQGGGGTELLPALKAALALPGEENQSRSIVVITDGYVTCEAEAFRLIRQQRNQANLYAFGIGSSVNRHLIEGMARTGGGTPFFILQPSEVSHELEKFKRYVESPVLTKIKLASKDFEIESVEPAAIPDLLAERPITIMGKWKGEARGELILTGYTGEGRFERRVAVTDGRMISESNALALLWARARITHFSDLEAFEGNQNAPEEILNLGMAYNLLTSYTSFLAVDETPVNLSGDLQSVRQPLPLPQGVSEFAITASSSSPIPSTPEPETWAMLGVLAAIIGFQAWLRKRKSCASK